MTILEAVASAAGALFTGGIFKILVDRFTMSKSDQYKSLVMLVEQLQKNVNENNSEIIELKKDVREWRERYYAELQEKTKLALEVSRLNAQLKIFNKSQHEQA
jgi:hypothetical protein